MIPSQLPAFRTEPLAEHLGFGVQILGLEKAAIEQPAVRQALHDLWILHGVLVFREVSGEDFQIDLSKCFGELIEHPTVEARAQRQELTMVRYRPADGWLMNVDGELRGSWLPWHSDLIYVDKINRGGILRPRALPDRLGETGFIDRISVYDDLPDDLRARIENLDVIYKYDLDPEHQIFGRTADVHVERFSDQVARVQARLDDFPRVLHPMVYTQRETGRKVLNLSPWFAVGIHGMENEEGSALLERVASYCVDSRRAYFHSWRIDDMVLWDNWRVLHCATGAPADQERWMERTTIAGDYGLGRPEAGAEVRQSDYLMI
jgi:taurine dioxygenase